MKLFMQLLSRDREKSDFEQVLLQLNKKFEFSRYGSSASEAVEQPQTARQCLSSSLGERAEKQLASATVVYARAGRMRTFVHRDFIFRVEIHHLVSNSHFQSSRNHFTIQFCLTSKESMCVEMRFTKFLSIYQQQRCRWHQFGQNPQSLFDINGN